MFMELSYLKSVSITIQPVLERRYWIYFEILETVQTQVPGGDITVFGGVSMVHGSSGEPWNGEMGHLSGSTSFDYKGSTDIQIYLQKAALL